MLITSLLVQIPCNIEIRGWYCTLKYRSSAEMFLALCCMLLGILIVCPETADGNQLTWNEPLPILTVQESAASQVVHRNRTRLIEGTINASLSWYFSLSSGLTLNGVNLKLKTDNIAFANNQRQEVPAGVKDKYAINWIPNQRITLVIFKVTSEHNATFTCEVGSTGSILAVFRSHVQVDVVAPPSNITTSSDQTIIAPAELTLNCSADGKPKPKISWTRVSDNTAVTMPLTISLGKNEESYKCTANNGVGKPLTKDVNITILFSPNVSLAKKRFVDRGRNASLICQVEGNPKPTISWSPCDLPNIVCDEQYLNVSNVQTVRANFNCTATNALGVDSASTVVLIGGFKIYLRLSVDEKCDKKDSIWTTLKNQFSSVFESLQYSGAELIVARCGNLIFDVVLTFETKVAEDEIISVIQSAIKAGKFEPLNLNASSIIGITPVEQPSTAAPTRTTPESKDNTALIIGVVVGIAALVALIVFIIWCVRKKKCCSERKEVSDNTDAAQGRKGKGPNGADEVAYASTSMLPHSKRPVEKTNQSTVQGLPMYAQVDKTKKTSNKGGAAQRQRQPGELQYAEVEHVASGRSLPRKSSSEPIKPSKDDIVYADLV